MDKIYKLSINFLILLISILVGFIIAEVIFRTTLNIRYQFKERLPGMRIYPYPGLAYDMEPCNLCTPKINSLGLRGEEINEKKPADSIRITIIGDSATFGVGVTRDEDTIPGRLYKLIEKNPPIAGKRFEVINAGIPGYDIQEIFLHYKYKIGRLNSDIVIYNFFPNDFLNSKFTVEKIDGRPTLIRFVDAKMPGLQVLSLFPESINLFLNKNSMLYRYSLFYISQLMKPVKVEESTYMDKYQQANVKYLYMLIDEIKKDDARLIISSEIYSFCANCKEPLDRSRCPEDKGCIAAYNVVRFVENEAVRLGIPYINLSNTVSEMNPKDVMVDDFAHYTGNANIIMAERLYEFLVDFIKNGNLK